MDEMFFEHGDCLHTTTDMAGDCLHCGASAAAVERLEQARLDAAMLEASR